MNEMSSIDSVVFILILLFCIFGFICFRQYMQYKMTGETGKFKVELCYEVYYRKKMLKAGRFLLSEKESFRVGYSKEEKYQNKLAIERLLDEEEIPEEDLKNLKKQYRTWFLIGMSSKQIVMKPSYLLRENMDGHKNVYIDDHILDSKGEAFEGTAVFKSDDSDCPAFQVFIYDGNAING